MQNRSVYQAGTLLLDGINTHFASEIAGKRIAVWGASNERKEVDETVCLVVDWLVEYGACVFVHDREVIEKVEERLGNTMVEYPPRQWDAVRGVDALIVASQSPQYCHIDAGRLCWSVREQTLFDVRDSVDRESLQYSDFMHYTLKGELESFVSGSTSQRVVAENTLRERSATSSGTK